MFPLELVGLTLEKRTVTAVSPVSAREHVSRFYDAAARRFADLFSLSHSAVPRAIFFTDPDWKGAVPKINKAMPNSGTENVFERFFHPSADIDFF